MHRARHKQGGTKRIEMTKINESIGKNSEGNKVGSARRQRQKQSVACRCGFPLAVDGLGVGIVLDGTKDGWEVLAG